MYYPGDDVFNASSFNAKVTLEPRTDFSENNGNVQVIPQLKLFQQKLFMMEILQQ